MRYVFIIFIILISISCRPELRDVIKQDPEKYPADQSGIVYPFFDVDIRPVILIKPTPFYTKDAVDDGAEGTVIVVITVLQNGDIEAADVTKKIHPQLDEEAQVAAKNMKFRPAIKDGKRVKCKLNVPFKFSLN